MKNDLRTAETIRSRRTNEKPRITLSMLSDITTLSEPTIFRLENGRYANPPNPDRIENIHFAIDRIIAARASEKERDHS